MIIKQFTLDFIFNFLNFNLFPFDVFFLLHDFSLNLNVSIAKLTPLFYLMQYITLLIYNIFLILTTKKTFFRLCLNINIGNMYRTCNHLRPMNHYTCESVCGLTSFHHCRVFLIAEERMLWNRTRGSINHCRVPSRLS